MSIVLNIGLNDKDLHKQILDTNTAIKIIADTIGDCTISQKTGVYHGEIEKSLEVVSYDITKEIAKKKCVTLCRLLNQESIYMSEQNIESECIYG